MTGPSAATAIPSKLLEEGTKVEAVGQKIMKDTTQIKHSVEFLNGASSNSTIKEILEKIEEKIKGSQPLDNVNVNTDEVDAEIKIESGEKDDVYNIKFTDIKIKQVQTQDKKQNEELAALNTLKKVRLFAHRKEVDGKKEYKFGVKFGKDGEEFTIGGDNEKLPYKSQVSALEDGFDKNLALIATATGSGKTITKLMFALVAKLRGMDVVSVNPRADLVGQEYEEQKGAVSKLGDINYDNSYKKEYKHNVVSLETFFNGSNEILDFSKFSKLLKDEKAENKEFKVDLKNKKITIGGNITIYKDYYTIGGKEYDENFIRDNIDNVLTNTAQLCVLIVFTKFSHHANAFSKDLELISSLTFGIVNPIELFVNNNTSDTTNNKPKDILQGIAERFFSRNSTTKEAFNHLKKHNPMSTGIRGDQFNTGTTMFSTLNVIMRGLAVVADYTAHSGDNQNSMSKKALGFFGDSSIRRAQEEIARLGKDVHKEVAEKCICEYLEMLRAGLNGRNYCPPQEPGDLPPILLNVCHSQKFLRDYEKASKDLFPASLIASPGIERLDGVQAGVKFGR